MTLDDVERTSPVLWTMELLHIIAAWTRVFSALADFHVTCRAAD